MARHDNEIEEEEELEEEEIEEEAEDADRGDDVGSEEEGEEEEEPDPEEEEEEEPEEEPEEEELDPDALEEIAGSGQVPYARFAEVSNRERQLLQALTALTGANKGGTEAKTDKPEFDLKAARSKYRAAIIEGDDAEAEKLEAQIDDHMADMAASKAQERMQAILDGEKARQFEADKEAGIAAVMRKYPQLDKAGRQTQEMLDLIVATRDVLLKRGMPIGKAIREAADRVMGGTGSGGQKRERKDPNSRSAAQIRESANKAQKIPPRTSGAGGSRQRHRDRDDVSEKELRQMSTRQLKEARGDFVD